MCFVAVSIPADKSILNILSITIVHLDLGHVGYQRQGLWSFSSEAFDLSLANWAFNAKIDHTLILININTF